MTYGRIPRRWNSYRPTYRGANTHTPPYSDDDRHSSSRPNRHESSSLSPLDSVNPNHIPLPGRPSIQAEAGDQDETDHLMAVTARAYALVIHYEEQSMGGTRWTAKDIELIRDAGSHLETDIRALRDLRKEVARMGDGRLVDQLDERVAAMHRYCYLIQDFIKDRENVPENQKKPEVLSQANAGGTSPDLAIKGAAAREEALKENRQYQGHGPRVARGLRAPTGQATAAGEMEWVSVDDEVEMAVRTDWTNSQVRGGQAGRQVHRW